MDMSKEERVELLGLFDKLRVADVRDGMDWMMMHSRGSMSPEIRPVFRTRTVGIARTCRYVPHVGTVPHLTPERYTDWVNWFYENICPYPWIDEIEKGDFCVIDQSGIDAGLMGSYNTLECVRKGARGFVTNGGVRDTDEIIVQNIPFWSKFISQKMVQARLQFDAKDVPVIVGDTLVHPGDIVVGDGDGVIVVPRKIAHDVAKYAHQEQSSDMAGRSLLYKSLGMKPDNTVINHQEDSQ